MCTSASAQSILQAFRRFAKPAVAGALVGLALLVSSPAHAQTDREAYLRDRVIELVERDFGGDLDAAYDHYSRLSDDDSSIDRRELEKLLEDADVGNLLTRGAWARGIIERFDAYPVAVPNGMVDRVELDYVIDQEADPPADVS